MLHNQVIVDKTSPTVNSVTQPDSLLIKLVQLLTLLHIQVIVDKTGPTVNSLTQPGQCW